MDDLKVIKKKYGEKMMHLCKKMFPTILENEGLLSKIMLSKFTPNYFLYKDIITNSLENEFKNYIYSFVETTNSRKYQMINKTPKELLSEAGYNLYECNSEEEIQKFKKYYAEGEELCTFKGDRLNKCYVFFAVKKDVDKIVRSNFKQPKRQDLYGTSVISIQFTKDDYNTLSIKNRYNHKVGNPDATFSNNLDNIIPGLTESFQREYGLLDKVSKSNFEIPNYVQADNGKYYKYNYEINNVYYCTNNTIIDNFHVKDLEKEKYILMDNYILDLQNKKIETYEKRDNEDAFVTSIGQFNNINIINYDESKKITIKKKDEESIEITLNKLNQIIGYKNNFVKSIKNDFLSKHKSLVNLELNNVQEIRDNFLRDNNLLKKIELPKCLKVGKNFLYFNKTLDNIYLPNCLEIDDNFLAYNTELRDLSIENTIKIKNNFLVYNEKLEYLNADNCEEIGSYFLSQNVELKEIKLNKCKKINDNCLTNNSKIKNVELLSCESIGQYFLNCAMRLENLNMPRIKYLGDNSLLDSKFVDLDVSEIREQSESYPRNRRSSI